MSTYGKRTNVELTYEGKNITKQLSEYIKSFSYKDNINTLDEIAVTVFDKDENWLRDWVTLKGDEINANIIVIENGENKVLKCGTFFLDDKEFGKSEFTFKAVSVDITSSLKNEEKTKIWSKTTLKNIASSIASAEKFSFKFTGNDLSIEKAEQKNQSNGGFLQQLCVMHGFSVKVMNKTIYVSELTALESLESEIVIEKKHCIDWKISETDNNTYDKCIIEYKDSKLGKKVKGTASVERPGYKQNTGKTLRISENFGVTGTFEQVTKQLNVIAAGKLREKNQDELTVSLGLTGDIQIIAGRRLTIKGFGQYDKYKYIIMSTEHKIQGGYTVSLEARRCLYL